MIKQGDRVKFISDTAVGVVTSIKGSVANVLVEDGFEIPAMLTDLVAVEAEQEKEAIKKMGVSEGKPINASAKQPKHQQESTKEKKMPVHSKPATQYGKISLVDEFEDEDSADLSTIRANYLKNMAIANAAEIKKVESVPPPPSPTQLTDYDIKLCFVPKDPSKPDESASYGLYIVNDSSYELFYTVSKWNTDGSVAMMSSGKMDADSKDEISTLRKEQLSTEIRLLVNLIFFKPLNYIPQPAESFTLEISPMKFLRRGNYVENDFFDEPSIVFTLASSAAPQKFEIDQQAVNLAIKEKEDIPRIQPKQNTEPEIIDLHVDEILDSTAGMSPGEILSAQMARFEIAMDLAISNNRRGRIVFIHGVGSGKLKYDMKKLLAAKYPKIRYQDASFKEYGYGAIMVYIK